VQGRNEVQVIATVAAKSARGTARRAAIAISNRKRTQYSEGLLGSLGHIAEILDPERVVAKPEVTPDLDQSWKSACGKCSVDALA
jgi:hypothetical protein